MDNKLFRGSIVTEVRDVGVGSHNVSFEGGGGCFSRKLTSRKRCEVGKRRCTDCIHHRRFSFLFENGQLLVCPSRPPHVQWPAGLLVLLPGGVIGNHRGASRKMDADIYRLLKARRIYDVKHRYLV